MAPIAEATVHVDAPPERVYGLISDVTRMGEWSPECYRCEWVGGATGPEPGARFKGSNKQGWMKWSTTAEVDVADPGREFTFSTRSGDKVSTRWSYRMAAAGGGTDVTESCEEVWTPFYVRIAEKTVMRNRPAQLQQGIRTTLERVKAAAESGTS
jgi:uncharacterized protein YndB with AHSA1/START domain